MIAALRGLICLILSLFMMAAAPSSGAIAQTMPAPEVETLDYDRWERDAQRAEGVLDTGAASNEGLSVLRQQLVTWRERFLAGQDINATRIQTLREQIEALGPAPEGDATEPDDIANRRATLEEQLQNSLAPVRSAEEAFTRANGLISQLDTLVRERQAERVFRLDPTPLNPVDWPAAALATAKVGETVTNEVTDNYAAWASNSGFRQQLPLTILLVVIGLVLVLRSGAWIERGLSKLRKSNGESHAGLRVATFLGSLFGVILPVAGILTLISALEAIELTSAVGDTIFAIIARLVAYVAAARWLSNQIFPRAYPPQPILTLGPVGLTEGRFYMLLLGALLALQQGIVGLSENRVLEQSMAPPVQGILLFPVILAAGIMLFRLGQLMLRALANAAEDDAGDASAGRSNLLTSILARGALVAGVLGPVAAAIGYVMAGSIMVFASVLTLALFAALVVAQRFIRDVYALLTRDEDKANALVPVLIGFILALFALPVLALIWGARTADITETFAMISAGVTLGDTRISPTDFITFAIIFAIGYMLTRLAQSALKTQVLPKTKIDLGGRNALVSGVGYIGIFLAALIAITTAGIDLSSLAIVAGALSVGIGFGLQTIVSNFVSGIILLVERPISEGDWIEVGGTMGVVRDISVRATRIETFDRRDVIVPNADLISTSVTNWTKGNLTGRIIVPVGVAYGTDTRLVERVLREIAEAHPQVILNPPPNIFFTGFGADSMDFEIRAILRDVNYVALAPSEINHEIARRFAEEGIEIPFAQRDLWLRNPETLRGTEAIES